jgi:hypothetical protein
MKPNLPEARWGFVLIFIVGCGALFAQICFGWQLNKTILVGGLLLDVLGALFLAIPDISLLHRWFFSGKVRQALNELELGWGEQQKILVEPGTEDLFVDALYIIDQVSGQAVQNSPLINQVERNPPPVTHGFYELRSAFKEGTNDSIWDRVFGFKTYRDSQGELRTYVLYDKNGVPGVKLKAAFENPFRKIRSLLNRTDARFRRLGVLLLISGFVFQGISVAV